MCERNAWELLEVLTDNDISASRYGRKARPGYQQLVEYIATGAVDRAVVYNLDRLMRQPRELEDLIDLCDERNGAFELHSITGEIDLRTSSGRFSARTLVAVAAMESDNLSRRLRRASDQKAQEGRPHGARAFGYASDDRGQVRTTKTNASELPTKCRNTSRRHRNQGEWMILG